MSDQSGIPGANGASQAGASIAPNTSSGGAPAASQHDGGEGQTVPLPKFLEMKAERKQLRGEVDALKAKLDQVAAASGQQSQQAAQSVADRFRGEQPEGDNVSKQDQFDWLIGNFMVRHPELFQEMMGFNPQDIQNTVQGMAQQQQANVRREFDEAVKQAGLNPESKSLRLAVGRYLDENQGHTMGQALEAVMGELGIPKPEPQDDTAGQLLRAGLSGAQQQVTTIPRNDQQARELTKSGKMMGTPSFLEILTST